MNGRILAGAVVASLTLLVPTGAAARGTTRVACGDVIDRSVRLANDLTNCPGDGLVAGASGITIDLNGHRIDGTGGGDGVEVFEHDDVTVKNGRIEQFGTGVSVLETALRTRIDRIAAADVGAGFSFFIVHDSAITRSVVRRARNGASLFLSNGNLIRDLSTADVEFIGVSLAESGDNDVDSNRFRGAGTGVNVFEAGQNRITRNVVVGGDTGVSLGITPPGNVIARNRIEDAAEAGIGLFEAQQPLLDSNVISDSSGNGVFVGALSSPTAVGNLVTGSGLDGFLVDPDASATLRDNRVTRNGDDGIDVETSAATLTRNRAFHNADFGIVAVPGVTDGGGNRAAGNGNPAQCAGVQCRR